MAFTLLIVNCGVPCADLLCLGHNIATTNLLSITNHREGRDHSQYHSAPSYVYQNIVSAPATTGTRLFELDILSLGCSVFGYAFRIPIHSFINIRSFSMRYSPGSVIFVMFFSGLVTGLSIPRAEVTCKLQLSQASIPLKYVSSKLNEFGEYGILADSATETLEVSFITRNNSEPMDLRVTGAGVDTPMLGGITGFFNEGEDLASGSYHYAYIGLTAQKPSGSAPQVGVNSYVKDYERKIESAIWSFDSTTGQVTPQWVNTDKSTPNNYVIYVDKQNALFITADKEKFVEEFKEEFNAQGVTPIEVTLNCV
ncbi:unnamed protein product [Rhizoctonia solani]|uniref:Uncharacterized protein n=1 Tax=Rhizoctonia solani TaxID=456999 RepID=A0A8H3GG92_9AGAM|nr:unnamed protein product [Rhizoctonia solani]